MLRRLTTELFIEKANIVHNNKYNYNKFIYPKNCKIKGIITCLDHGDFEQTPDRHLSGNGCYECGLLKISNMKASHSNDFILKANIVHKNKYNYSKVNYKRTHDKVEIICSKHGSFFQTPTVHLAGCGCLICDYEKRPGTYASVFKYNPEFELYLYHMKLIDSTGFEFFKIGLSINPIKRSYGMTGLKVTILETEFGKIKDLYPKEQKLHEIIKELNIQYMPQELMKDSTSGYTECYKW